MASIAIVTDSTADFAGIEPADLGITVVPLTVHWGRDVLRDRVDLSTSEFYDRLRTDPNLPKTAAPPVGIFEEVFRECVSRYDAVIAVHIAATLSSTWSVAANAASTVAPERIYVVDSTSTSVGLGWLVQHAVDLASGDVEASTIVAALEEMIPRIRLYLTLESLEYLQRGGRIGRAQAFVGALLSVKPVLQVAEGAVIPIERVRTRAGSIRRVAELGTGAGPMERLAVVHGDCEAEAVAVRDELTRRLPEVPINVTEVGAVIATYTGPGIVGVGCVLAS